MAWANELKAEKVWENTPSLGMREGMRDCTF